jgi:hypothetical protein
MTEAQVEKLIEDAAARGIEVDRSRATTFLGARELLARDPDHEDAKRVVIAYSQFLQTGKPPKDSFAEFLMGPFETDEEIAEEKKQRDEYLARHPQ